MKVELYLGFLKFQLLKKNNKLPKNKKKNEIINIFLTQNKIIFQINFF